MIRLICFTVIVSGLISIPDQVNPKGTEGKAKDLSHTRFLHGDPGLMAERIFPLFTVIEDHRRFFDILRDDSTVARISKEYNSRINCAIDTCSNAQSLSEKLKWTLLEIEVIRKRLKTLFDPVLFRDLFSGIRISAAGAAHYRLSDGELIDKVWMEASMGINRIFDIYIAGKPPHYASIDSISIDNRSKAGYARLVCSLKGKLGNQGPFPPFYSVPLTLAIEALLLNDRDEAVRYEPLDSGINYQVLKSIKQIDFSKYKYSAILIPGYGPEEPGVNLDHRSIRRCEMAVKHFADGMAPLLIVSGGHVYPAGTPFSEAVEMRSYLMNTFNIPANAIITEPYARHTTTNVRNASRLVYMLGLPDNMPVMVSTDSLQTLMVVNLEKRCLRELGYTPFRNVTLLSSTTSYFYPVPESFQVNANDPLDP